MRESEMTLMMIPSFETYELVIVLYCDVQLQFLLLFQFQIFFKGMGGCDCAEGKNRGTHYCFIFFVSHYTYCLLAIN